MASIFVNGGWAKAVVEVTTKDGQTRRIELVDDAAIHLVGQIDVNVEQVEVPPEENGYLPWREFRPGRKTVRVELAGLMAEAATTPKEQT